MDLLLDLPTDLTPRAAVEHALREAIAQGQLVPGSPLPSTRELAGELGLARGTIVAAVEQLRAEGVLQTRQGAPTRVAHVPPAPSRRAAAARREAPDPPHADFYSGDPDLTLFPRAVWSSAVRRVLGAADASMLGYGDSQGNLVLRTALVDYLGRTRGVVAEADRVVITAGFSQTLAVVARALRASGRGSIAVENPSFWRHRELLSDACLAWTPVGVDTDGVHVEVIRDSAAEAALVTPAHHTPLGVSLSPDRRAALARWATDGNHFVVEDDYDGELRYDRRPLRALQSLSPTHVVYCGTASKSFAPGLRLAWCVLPASLVDPAITALRSLGDQSVSIVDQLALADLLHAGHYDRQVRRIRAEYGRRRDQLVAELSATVPAVRVEGVAAGLKAVLRLPPSCDEATVVEALASRSVAVAGLARFYVDDTTTPGGPAIVVNYGRPYGHQYRAALTLLAEGLSALLPATSSSRQLRGGSG